MRNWVLPVPRTRDKERLSLRLVRIWFKGIALVAKLYFLTHTCEGLQYPLVVMDQVTRCSPLSVGIPTRRPFRIHDNVRDARNLKFLEDNLGVSVCWSWYICTFLPNKSSSSERTLHSLSSDQWLAICVYAATTPFRFKLAAFWVLGEPTNVQNSSLIEIVVSMSTLDRYHW